MNVTDQLQLIDFLFADEGFVPVLEQMARALMAKIEVNGVTGEKPAHKRRKTGFVRTKQEMTMWSTMTMRDSQCRF